MDFINTIFLLLAITGLGMFSRHKQLFSSDDKIVLNSFIYRFALPALLIDTISGVQFNLIEMEIIVGSVVPVFLTIFFIIFLYQLKMLNKEQMIISSITLGFGSNAFFGIAYFDSLYGSNAMDFAILSAAVLGMLGIVISVAFFEYAKNGIIKPRIFFSVLYSPPVFAIIIGVALAMFGIELTFFDKASALLGKTAGGLSIFVLGMFIYDVFSIQMIKAALPYVLLRAVLLPIFTLITLMFLPEVTTDLYSYLLQQSGIPAAIAIAILAQRYDYQQQKLSAIVMLSSLFSFIVLAVLYMMSSV